VIVTCGTDDGIELDGTRTGLGIVGGIEIDDGGTHVTTGIETTGITTVDGTLDGTCGDGTTQIPVVMVTCGTDDGIDELGTKTGDGMVGGIVTVGGGTQTVGV